MLKIYDQGFFFIVLRIRDLVGIFDGEKKIQASMFAIGTELYCDKCDSLGDHFTK